MAKFWIFGGISLGYFLPIYQGVDLFYLRLGLFYLRLVFVAYGQLAWSSLLTVEIRFGRSAYGGNSVWSFLLTVPPARKLGFVFFAYGSPRPEIGFGVFCLRFPTVSKKTNHKAKDLTYK